MRDRDEPKAGENESYLGILEIGLLGHEKQG
jgi:hypothetical protein